MSVNPQLRDELPEDAIVFDNMSYDGSIIGVTTDGRNDIPDKYPCVIYFGIADFDGMRGYDKKLDWIYIGKDVE